MTAPPEPSPGLFVTIEGPEGAGKTTQASRLSRYLEDHGRAVLLVREPGGTPLGEKLRTLLLARDDGLAIDPRADALLFNAARAQLVEERIRPALARGDVVISTRYSDSTVAYQGYGLGVPIDALRSIERFATGGLVPDRTVLLDLPVDMGLSRKTGADRSRFEAAYDPAFHERVRQGFLALARNEAGRFRVVAANEGPDAVFARVVAAVLDGTGVLDDAPGREPNQGALRIER